MSVPIALAQLAQESTQLDVSLTLPGILSLLAGILILVVPRLLNYIVAFYLIIVGLLLIFNVSL
jgi:hypothetical protein